MSKDVGVDEEMAEVEEEIAAKRLNNQLDDAEAGGAPINKVKNTPFYVEIGNQIQNLASFIFTPIWIQVFVMTFWVNGVIDLKLQPLLWLLDPTIGLLLRVPLSVMVSVLL